jgi:hypothetical protein
MIPMKTKTITVLLTDISWATIDGKTRLRLSGIKGDGRNGTVEAASSGGMADAVLRLIKENCAERGFEFEKIVQRNQYGASDIDLAQIELQLHGSWMVRGNDPRRPDRKRWIFMIGACSVLKPVQPPMTEAAFSAFARDAVRLAVKRSDCHKSSEGWLSIGWEWPNIFQTDQRPRAKIELYCYVLGPSRNYEWTGRTMEEAIARATADISIWLIEEALWTDEDGVPTSWSGVLEDREIADLFARHGVAVPRTEAYNAHAAAS